MGSPRKHPDDESILELFADPESRERGFGLLMEKYQKRIYWQVRRMVIDHEDANDLTQEVFVKIWKNLTQFGGRSSLSTWIYRIVANEVFSFLKKKKKTAGISMTGMEDHFLGKLQADPYFTGDEIQQKLQLALMNLPPKQRMVFQMKYYDETKYEEMSKILDTSVGALKASYHHAVKKIQQSIQED